jgi:predicted HTH domain antitoxin
MLILDDAIFQATGYTVEELKLQIAVLLFPQQKLSLRKAAALAGMHWLLFMKEPDRRQIALHCDESLL